MAATKKRGRPKKEGSTPKRVESLHGTFPTARKWVVDLKGGRRAVIKQSFSIETLEVKLKLPSMKPPRELFTIGDDGGLIPAPHDRYYGGRYARDKKGNFIKAPVQVEAVTVKIEVSSSGGGRTLTGRSYCKPPDIFDANEGTRLALHHLFSKDVDKLMLSKGDRAEIMRACCPSFFSKMPQKVQSPSKTLFDGIDDEPNRQEPAPKGKKRQKPAEPEADATAEPVQGLA